MGTQLRPVPFRDQNRAELLGTLFVGRSVSIPIPRDSATKKMFKGETYLLILCQEVLQDGAGARSRYSLKAFKLFAAAQLAEENIDFLIEVRAPICCC